jgi:hypothetical protein
VYRQLELLMRKKKALHLEQRLEALVDDTFYHVRGVACHPLYMPMAYP